MLSHSQNKSLKWNQYHSGWFQNRPLWNQLLNPIQRAKLIQRQSANYFKSTALAVELARFQFFLQNLTINASVINLALITIIMQKNN